MSHGGIASSAGATTPSTNGSPRARRRRPRSRSRAWLAPVALAVAACTVASCTRTIHHAAVPPRDVTFSALSDLYAGPWAQGVTTASVDPSSDGVAGPDGAAPDVAGDAGNAIDVNSTCDGSNGGAVCVPSANPPNLPKEPPAPSAAEKNAPDPKNPILATIRQVEAGNNYQAQAPGSSASGAYQILNEVWAGFGGFNRAADAPPAIQDTKAAQLIIAVLGRSEDVGRIPVAWYIGHVPGAGSREWDVVPAPYAGNTLTPRQYQAKWLKVYNQKYQAVQGDSGGS